MAHGVSIFFGLAVGALALLTVVWLYILLPAGMAERRNRSALIWVLISIVGSPLLAILLLLALGEDKSEGGAKEPSIGGN